jgi:hypothetical protein
MTSNAPTSSNPIGLFLDHLDDRLPFQHHHHLNFHVNVAFDVAANKKWSRDLTQLEQDAEIDHICPIIN